MESQPEPDAARLAGAREHVHTFMIKKQRFTTALFWLTGLFEAVFLVVMLVLVDFKDPLQVLVLCGFVFLYCPLITFTWRNSIKIDHLYYRLLDELKYGPREE